MRNRSFWRSVNRSNAKRSTDLPARFGGEEFALILPLTPLAGVQQQGQALCDAVAALQLPHRGSTVGACVSVSVGCAARVPQHGELSSLLIDAADFALYDAKHRGKNRISLRDRSGA